MPGQKSIEISRRKTLQLAATAAGAKLAPGMAWAAAGERSAAIVPDLRDQLFDDDWCFMRGDGANFAAIEFDDGGWRLLDLPHDWSIEDRSPSSKTVNAVMTSADTAPLWQRVKDAPREIGPFFGDATLIGEGDLSSGGRDTGHMVGGVGWYRKRFRLPLLESDACVQIVFDGVYMNSEVWLNGNRLGEHHYGYTPFSFDLTPFLNRDGENVLAVRVANLGHNSRWYSGSGIYRSVRLNVTRKQHFALWGVSVTTPAITEAEATVQLRARTENVEPGAQITARIYDASGAIVAQSSGAATPDTLLSLKVSRPQLWSPETPALYRAECDLNSNGRSVDRVTTTFGIRQVLVDAVNGLTINGKSYKLRGGCIHHDNGLLGAAAIDRAEERKIELLKARGYNAIRTSHNPPSPTLLNACDQLGFLVMEEAFDCWRVGKNPEDYNVYFDGWWQDDLAAMIARDGNHPSVIFWSIGNEIPEAGKPDGVETARKLAEAVRRLDPTRPVTQAINISNGPDVTRADGKPDQAATQFLDVAGYNYKLQTAEPEHKQFPDRVVVGTESMPNQVVDMWRIVDRAPYVIGDFVWTAMDYLGESGIGMCYLSGDPIGTPPYPWFNSFCGDVDLIGQQKPQSLLRDVVWGLSPVEIAVVRPVPENKSEHAFPWGWFDELRSWTWPGQENKSINVSAYTLGDHVELTLDGRKVGEVAISETDKQIAKLTVPYAPGKLVATAYKNGQQIGQSALETVGAPAALRLKADRSQIRGDNRDLAYVTVDIIDREGRLVPDAVEVVEIAVSGPGELAAFGNANPRGVASFRQPVAKTWRGQALVILRPKKEAGKLVVEARAKGLRGAKATVTLV